MADRPVNILSLCTGGGGLDLGVELAIPTARVVCGVEREVFAVAHLGACMEAGCMDPFPVWSDLRTFDGRPWRGVVDCIAAGYPCQPFSHAGNRLGADDERHLWPHVARIVGEVEPEWCLFENVDGHVTLGLPEVVSDLRRLGYLVPRPCLLEASGVGAPHRRSRVFILAVRAGGGLRELRRAFDAGFSDERGEAVEHADRIEGGHEVAGRGPDRRAPDRGAGELPLFPPGSRDTDGWRRVLEARPDLAPAIRGRLNPRFVAWLMNWPIPGEDYAAHKARSRKAMQELLGPHGESENEWTLGRPWRVQSPCVLQPPLHGGRHDEGTSISQSLRATSQKAPGGQMREVRHNRQSVDPPQRQELEEQQSGESGDALRLVSHLASSCARGDLREAERAALQILRSVIVPQHLPHMQNEAQEAWNGATEEERVDALVESFVAKTANSDRRHWLRLLGNGVVPLQAAHALRVLVDRTQEEPCN